jgi:hypothetical protein
MNDAGRADDIEEKTPKKSHTTTKSSKLNHFGLQSKGRSGRTGSLKRTSF